MPKVIAVCRSDEKGTRKQDIRSGYIKDNYGLADDAHADCCTHRQVSLLDMSSINKMRNQGYEINPGDFAENLTTEGIDLISLPIGTRLSIGKEAILEISQIGKDCHTGCAIFQQIGKCIMPKEGVFARVIHGGQVNAGDEINVQQGND